MSAASDDFRWFWAGESGRDQLLRDSVEDLHAQLSSSSRRSSRLSSQLAALQGSMEARLSALTVAFDAYVELGDIREQLAGYPDTSQIRREASEALAAVTAGRTAEPIDARDLPYWLPHATNAVLAIAAGSPDPAAEESARALSPDAELFIVAAAGVVGHGGAVRDRLPNLLVSDGTLSPAQVRLWQAAVDGTFGEPAEVLAGVEPQWRGLLEAVEDQDWLQWVRRRGGDSPTAMVEWVRDLTTGESTEKPAQKPAQKRAQESAQDGLKLVVSELAGQGVGDEARLLRRARALRARIETPTGAAPEDADTEPPRTPVVDVVRETLVELPSASPARAPLLRWLTPALLSVLETTQARAAQAPAFVESVSSPGGSIRVGPQGADAAEVEQRVATIRSINRPSPIPLYAFAGIGAAGLVMALIMLAVNPAYSAIFFILTAVGLIGAAYQWVTRQRLLKEAELDVTSFREKVADAQASAAAEEQSWRTDLEHVRLRIGSVREALPGPVAAGPPAGDLR